MLVIGNIVGLTAVILFVASYQMKTRRNIILFNAISRVLFVTQYILLGAFEGALLDTIAFFVSLLCQQREKKWIKNHLVLTIFLCNIAITALGLLTYKNIFSLLPILGVIFETLALWLKKERHIRFASLLGAPPWLVYNTLCGAYGSSLGNAITLVSITVAIIRYDVLKKDKTPVDT
jgi:hypothetical protein